MDDHQLRELDGDAIRRGREHHARWVERFEKQILTQVSRVSSKLLADGFTGKKIQDAFNLEMLLIGKIRRVMKDIGRGKRAFCRRGTAREMRRLVKIGVTERLRALRTAVEDSTAAFVLNQTIALDPVANLQSVDLRMLYRFRAGMINGRPSCDLCAARVENHHAVVKCWSGLHDDFFCMCVSNINFSDFVRPDYESVQMDYDESRVRGFRFETGPGLRCAPDVSDEEEVNLPWEGL